MKPMQLGMKFTKIISKPFKMFFGTDEKSFLTLLGAVIALYFSGFPDAASIVAVYDAIFAYSGMQKYDTGSSSETSQEDAMPDELMETMDEAMSMANELQENEEVKEDA